MYRLSVSRDFVAQHFLTVPDPGPEGEIHSHHFHVDVRLTAPELNEYGYVADIDAVRAALDDLEARYRDALLNDLPEFEGSNPSVERFARAFGDRFVDAVPTDGVTTATVRIREDDDAWASHERSLG